MDWEKVKADYLESGQGYRVLAKKYEVPLSTLATRARREAWCALREKSREMEETGEKVSEGNDSGVGKGSGEGNDSGVGSDSDEGKGLDAADGSGEGDRGGRLQALADRLLEKLEQAVEQVDEYTLRDAVRVKTVQYDDKGKAVHDEVSQRETLRRERGGIDTSGLRQISATLKDLRDLRDDGAEEQLLKLDQVLEKIGGKL